MVNRVQPFRDWGAQKVRIEAATREKMRKRGERSVKTTINVDFREQDT